MCRYYTSRGLRFVWVWNFNKLNQFVVKLYSYTIIIMFDIREHYLIVQYIVYVTNILYYMDLRLVLVQVLAIYFIYPHVYNL